jgi:hypothetical protein
MSSVSRGNTVKVGKCGSVVIYKLIVILLLLVIIQNNFKSSFIRISFNCKFALTARVSVVHIAICNCLSSAVNIHFLSNILHVYFYGRQ